MDAARKLRNDAFQLVIHFPSEEKYGLTYQIKRASRSITACIAEGHGRFTHKDQIHFCIIAGASATELLNHFIDAFDQKYIDRQILKSYQLIIEEIIKMLNGLISYLRKQANNSKIKV
jgi:four helix bundle protein